MADKYQNNDPKKRMHDEEYATDFTAVDVRKGNGEETTTTYGWIGIVLSILSFLVWPLLLGAAGIILGFVSRNKGSDTLGNVAIGIGVLSILLQLIL